MRPTVVKVGGGLVHQPGALARVGAAVARLAARHPVVVVPGGGPFADAVREFDRRERLAAETAHWMAIIAMDQFAHVLRERIPGAVLAEEPGDLAGLAGRGSAVVLAPSRWLRAADVLPHGWEVTSDSLAAWIAGALDADRLVLVKPVAGATADLTDPHFRQALPHDLPCVCLGWEEIDRLPELRSGGGERP